jgi:hypothetical protein
MIVFAFLSKVGSMTKHFSELGRKKTLKMDAARK